MPCIKIVKTSENAKFTSLSGRKKRMEKAIVTQRGYTTIAMTPATAARPNAPALRWEDAALVVTVAGEAVVEVDLAAVVEVEAAGVPVMDTVETWTTVRVVVSVLVVSAKTASGSAARSRAKARMLSLVMSGMRGARVVAGSCRRQVRSLSVQIGVSREIDGVDFGNEWPSTSGLSKPERSRSSEQRTSNKCVQASTLLERQQCNGGGTEKPE
jgi:hypothetical protein